MQNGQQCQRNDIGVLQNDSFIQQYGYPSVNSPTFGDRVLIYDDNPTEREGILYRSDSIFSDESIISGYTMIKNNCLKSSRNDNIDISTCSGPSRKEKHSPIIRRSSTSPPHISEPYSPNSYRQSSPYYSNSPSSSPRTLSPILSSKQSPTLGSEQSRAESGLLLLTERVIEYAKQSPKFEIDLQGVENKLGVPRRRLYDITNVLEAVGLFTKPRHNIYKLNLDTSSGLLQDEENDENIMFYTKSLLELEQAISNMKNSIQDLIMSGQQQGLMYVDKEILSKLCPVNLNTIVSISSPIDTSIILNPNQHSYQLLNSILRTKGNSSDNGMISVQSQVLDSHWSILLKHQSSQLNVDVINGHANILEEVRQATPPMQLPLSVSSNNSNIADHFLQ